MKREYRANRVRIAVGRFAIALSLAAAGCGDDPVVEDRSDELINLSGVIGAAVRVTQPWRSVLLFYRLPRAAQPAGYFDVTAENVRDWFAAGGSAGTSPETSNASLFMQNYWRQLSQGTFQFRLTTVRDAPNPRSSIWGGIGDPLIPTLNVATADIGVTTSAYLDRYAERVWRASGGRLTSDGRRWVPSIVNVTPYPVQARAGFGSYAKTVGGIEYVIGDNLFVSYGDGLGVLAHEYSHNFIEFTDLYGPQGCTGYWDILGSAAAPGAMSELSSYFKARMGWLRPWAPRGDAQFKEVVRGPRASSRAFELRPYTTTGDAIKIIPDPEHNPYEFFLLEFRKSTGRASWMPDGAIPAGEEGLLVLHMNERMNGPTWNYATREAPFLDVEMANFMDGGGAAWLGADRISGVLFRRWQNFDPTSRPASAFYGGRYSGLSVRNINVVGDVVRFEVEIDAAPRVAWTFGARDRCIRGRFGARSAETGDEMFCRNDSAAALLVHRNATWLARPRQDGWVGAWQLGANDREVAVDLDGDGRDEIFIARKTPAAAAVLKWDNAAERFVTIAMETGARAARVYETLLAGDFDGDGRNEVIVRGGKHSFVLRLVTSASGARIDEVRATVDGAPWRVKEAIVGRFTQPVHDEVLLREAADGGRFALQWLDPVWGIVTKSIGADFYPMESDTLHRGRFTGRKLDELTVRTATGAALVRWDGYSLATALRADGEIPVASDPARQVVFTASDTTIVGRFVRDADGQMRDAILHSGVVRAGAARDPGEALLSWDGNDLVARGLTELPFRGAANRKIVVGDFYRKDMDVLRNLTLPGARADWDTAQVDTFSDVFFFTPDDSQMTAVLAWPSSGRYEVGPSWQGRGRDIAQSRETTLFAVGAAPDEVYVSPKP